jgi:hypothetical protein
MCTHRSRFGLACIEHLATSSCVGLDQHSAPPHSQLGLEARRRQWPKATQVRTSQVDRRFGHGIEEKRGVWLPCMRILQICTHVCICMFCLFHSCERRKCVTWHTGQTPATHTPFLVNNAHPCDCQAHQFCSCSIGRLPTSMIALMQTTSRPKSSTTTLDSACIATHVYGLRALKYDVIPSVQCCTALTDTHHLAWFHAVALGLGCGTLLLA